MKKILRFVGMGTVLTAMFALGAAAAFAQDDKCADVDGQTALYTTITTTYKIGSLPDLQKKIDSLQKAVDAGKQFLEKYGSCEPAKPQVDWMTPKIPQWEDTVKKLKEELFLNQQYEKFNNSTKAKSWDDVYASGKEILRLRPDTLDAILVLGSIGLDESSKKNNKYNDDTLTFAKLALDKMNSGVASKTYGIFTYTYNTKENATGWMNLTIGYLLFEPKGDKKGGLPYLYKATTTGTAETKENALPYSLIGKYFRGDAEVLRDQLKDLLAKQPPATAPDDEKTKWETEYKAKLALFNGTLERSMDGYSRAWKFAKPGEKDGIYQSIKGLYAVRFQKDTGIDAYIASTTAKPLLDPLTPVTPVEDVETTPTTTKTTSTTPTTPTKPAGSKPGSTSGVTKAATASEIATKASDETAATAKPKAGAKTAATTRKRVQ